MLHMFKLMDHLQLQTNKQPTEFEIIDGQEEVLIKYLWDFSRTAQTWNVILSAFFFTFKCT